MLDLLEILVYRPDTSVVSFFAWKKQKLKKKFSKKFFHGKSKRPPLLLGYDKISNDWILIDELFDMYLYYRAMFAELTILTVIVFL